MSSRSRRHALQLLLEDAEKKRKQEDIDHFELVRETLACGGPSPEISSSCMGPRPNTGKVTWRPSLDDYDTWYPKEDFPWKR